TMSTSVSIVKHTTSSTPQPHVLYIIEVLRGGVGVEVTRRFSEFVRLHELLDDPYTLPDKKLTHQLLPLAWLDDDLICERKRGLSGYINDLLRDPLFNSRPELLDFLALKLDIPLMTSVTGSATGFVSTNVSARRNISRSASCIAASYYPNWVLDTFPPENIDFSKFDIIYYAFATPNSSSNISWETGSQDISRRLINAARNSGQGTKIVLSVGGWSGSYWFSQAMSNDDNRGKLVKSLLDAVSTFSLDGIDIDWEYPASPGSGNPHSSQDSGNFLQFLQALRSALGPRKIISAAVTHLPWLGSDGRPMSDVSDFAAELTYLNIMNYDVNDPSSDPTPSPNAPLGNHCGNSSQPEANASAALASWTSAGFPAHKLVLGLAIYGYVYQSTRTTLSQVVRPPRMTHPCRLIGFSDCVTDGSGDLSLMFGRQIPFLQLIDAGVLYRADDGSYKAKNGYTRGWDHCSTTPFLFSQERRTVVSYDDPTSLGAKARFARSQGMAGCFTWSLEQDDDGHLQDGIRMNLGKS
ncbi:glycoside hydrolase, partial [Fistulina hepatica ATCC 64428]